LGSREKSEQAYSDSEDDDLQSYDNRQRQSCGFLRKHWKEILFSVGLITTGVGIYLYTTSNEEDEKNIGAYLMAGGGLAILISLSLAWGCCYCCKKRSYEEDEDPEMG
jgi:hypothetical protein